ncbi:hypothetical protein [Clostridium senegalense]|uniref:hypothetical protein n=1 Tax=Clostridium senegalense TaxID=1465809 RepID=UPI0002898B09|nr:hypothetical protein [Clostridium senegalense]MBU5226209.1 hypothetical protein [Clostridium senegalense]
MSDYNNDQIKNIVSGVLKSDRFAVTPLSNQDCDAYEINIKGEKYATFKVSNNPIATNNTIIEQGTLENGENWILELK